MTNMWFHFVGHTLGGEMICNLAFYLIFTVLKNRMVQSMVETW